MRRLSLILLCFLVATGVFAQAISTPPNGDNQKSAVTQHIGLVKVTVEYNSPDVHGPDGKDRKGEIWGKLVHYGMIDEQFGTCKECPWRAGANENTTFAVSHDVKVEGQPLKAGKYGLHMIAGPDDWTVIFSNNSSSWGSYYYDPSEDALRVKVKPSKAEYNEWLTYEFIDRKVDSATVALKWEELQVPIKITVDDPTSMYIAKIKDELRSSPGFQWQNWLAAANYALAQKRNTEALDWANNAVNRQFIGRENFQTLSTLANAQDANGQTAEAKATRDKAFNHPTAAPGDLHQYARQQLMRGNKDEALRVWQLNQKRFGDAWPVNVGLARGYSATGKYKDALKYAKLAAAQAPDEVNKKSMQDAIKKLEQGQDFN